MNLENFPMDVQRCPLKLGSCEWAKSTKYQMKLDFEFPVGYTTSDVLYRWNANRGVVISEDLRMSQFDLIDVPSSNESIAVGKEDSVKIVCKEDTLGEVVGKKMPKKNLSSQRCKSTPFCLFRFIFNATWEIF